MGELPRARKISLVMLVPCAHAISVLASTRACVFRGRTPQCRRRVRARGRRQSTPETAREEVTTEPVSLIDDGPSQGSIDDVTDGTLRGRFETDRDVHVIGLDQIVRDPHGLKGIALRRWI